MAGMSAEPSGDGAVRVGRVVDNEDPDGLGRVKVEYVVDSLEDERTTEAVWSRVAAQMAGDEHGTYFLPEVGDDVVLAFDGATAEPFVLGALWNSDRPPQYDNDDGDNDHKEVRSRSGHRLTFDDDERSGGVEIETDAGHTIVLDDSDGGESVSIEDESGENRIELDPTEGKVTIEAGDTLCLSARNVEVDADSTVAVSGREAVQIDSEARVDVSSKGQLTLESNGLGTLEAAGPLNIRGAIIQIN